MSGPLSAAVRDAFLPAAAAIRAALERYDSLMGAVIGGDEPWVITHGEPHAANFIWTARRPVLVDWDTCLIAPAERDLWMLQDPDGSPADSLFRLGWDLKDLALYVSEFRRPHEDSEDTRKSLQGVRLVTASLRADYGG